MPDDPQLDAYAAPPDAALDPTKDAGLDAETILAGEDRPVPVERLVGIAGTGKTTTIRRRAAADGNIKLTSTTGISAVNLGTITLHSTLKYFDTNSLRDSLITGQLASRLHEVSLFYRWLCIEEYSMLDADALDYIYQGVIQANRYHDVREPLGIILVGDLAQLPPVKARWCFEAGCWSEFAAHTTRLTHVWRQDQGPFLDALNHVRMGRGMAGSEILVRTGIRWHTALDTDFAGTTILPKNAQVSRYNELGLAKVKAPEFVITSRRWGQQRPEWGENLRTHEWGIPPRVKLKIGAYVMCLANDTEDFSVANGDCGYIVDHSPGGAVVVHLVRTDEDVFIYPIVRSVDSGDRPDDFGDDSPRISADDDVGEYLSEVHYRGRIRRYVTGQIEFYPLRLAYATTVHKSQSLTLDRVQCDFRDHFFSSPAMLYTALSRCRSLNGLRLVGSPERFVKQCQIDSRILPWL